MTAAGLPRTEPSDGVSRWSKCAWDTRTRSTSGSSSGVSAHCTSRIGPSVPRPEIHADARIQRRIGQDADAVEVDQHRCVPEPGERHRIVRPRGRSRLVRGRGDVTSDLLEALPEEPRAPGR